MAKRRTKKDKIIAQLRREVTNRKQNAEVEYSLEGASKDDSKTSSGKTLKKIYSKTYDLGSLFSYDSRLIRSDLVKTSILSLIAFAIIIGLSIAWR